MTITANFFKKYGIYMLLGALGFEVGIIGTYFIARQFRPKTPLAQTQSQVSTPEVIQNPDNLNILLLGYGGAGHDGGYLTDTIMLVHVNYDQKAVGLISIPRDLWVDGAKINAAFAKGEEFVPNKNLTKEDIHERGGLAKSAFEKVTGFPVDHYVAVDFVGFQRAVGEIGGIEVDVKVPLDDPWYPTKGRELDLCGMGSEEIAEVHEKYSGFELERQFECRYERIVYGTGIHHMEGGDAMAYVRSRHTTSDFDRGRRAADVLMAVKDKLLDIGALEESAKFFERLAYTFQSDVDTTILENIIPSVKLAMDFRVVNIGLNTDNVLNTGQSRAGAFILFPKAGDGNWQEVQDYIASELTKEQ